jgi:hypothetical protein
LGDCATSGASSELFKELSGAGSPKIVTLARMAFALLVQEVSECVEGIVRDQALPD